MKITKLFYIFAICSCLTILTGCSTFSDHSSLTPDNNSELSTIASDDDLDMGISESEILPERPTKGWAPVTGLNFPTVYFSFDQSGVGTSQVKKLDAVASYMEKHKELGLIIEGSCDEKGSGEYNIGLGERRALSVRDYLEKLGIFASRLQTISYGSERPAVSEHSESAWSKNRRAELVPAKM